MSSSKVGIGPLCVGQQRFGSSTHLVWSAAPSAVVLVAGTAGARVNRSTPSRLSRSRCTRLRPCRRFLRPRFPGGAGAGSGFPSDRLTTWTARRSRRAIVSAHSSSPKSTRSWSSRRMWAAQSAACVARLSTRCPVTLPPARPLALA